MIWYPRRPLFRLGFFGKRNRSFRLPPSAILGFWGHWHGVARPSIGEQAECFPSLRGPNCRQAGPNRDRPQKRGHCGRACVGLVRAPNAWSIASRLRKVSGHGRKFRMGDAVFECRRSFANPWGPRPPLRSPTRIEGAKHSGRLRAPSRLRRSTGLGRSRGLCQTMPERETPATMRRRREAC
jgi:hypothetical protein